MKIVLAIALISYASSAVSQTSYITESVIKDDSVSLRFVGSGDIQKSIVEAGKGVSANTGIGVSFQRFFSEYRGFRFLKIKQIDLDLTINVASTVDTVEAELAKGSDGKSYVYNASRFGSSILVPANSGQATYLSGFFYVDNADKWHSFISGFHLLAQGSNRNWSIDSITLKSSNVALRVALFGELLPDKVRIKNNYSIKVGYGFSVRSLQGDAGQHSRDEFREQFFGTKRNTWYGTEAFTQLRVGNLVAEVSYMWLSKRDQSFAGLTGSNLVTSIRFTGGFNLDLKK